jgi:hypothetical protein
MAMDNYLADYTVREQFREMAALDRQMTRWGWFRRHEHHPRKTGWRFQLGKGLISLGCWLQGRGGAQPAQTSGKS